MKKYIVLLPFLFNFSFLIFNSSAQPTFIKDSLDTYVEREMKRWNIPGAAVAIVKDGKVIAMKGYGVKEVGKPDKVDENTLFQIELKSIHRNFPGHAGSAKAFFAGR
jgi:CubicO group peptidase (beta-lactamase class C family)